MTKLYPYLSFDNNCEEAFNFYKSVFGGEFSAIQHFKNMPAEHQGAESEGNKIMHVALPVGSGSMLMGSDTFDSMPKTIIGTNNTVSLHPDSLDEATRLFNGLSEGGKVTMPLEKAFWGAYFGMFTDKFNIPWMINFDTNQK